MCRQFDSGLRQLYILRTSGSVVERRLAKAKVAGSIPVSCFFLLSKSNLSVSVNFLYPIL